MHQVFPQERKFIHTSKPAFGGKSYRVLPSRPLLRWMPRILQVHQACSTTKPWSCVGRRTKKHTMRECPCSLACNTQSIHQQPATSNQQQTPYGKKTLPLARPHPAKKKKEKKKKKKKTTRPTDPTNGAPDRPTDQPAPDRQTDSEAPGRLRRRSPGPGALRARSCWGPPDSNEHRLTPTHRVAPSGSGHMETKTCGLRPLRSFHFEPHPNEPQSKPGKMVVIPEPCFKK